MREIKINKSITVRSQIINIYFDDVKKFSEVTPQQEVALMEKIHKGDRKALETLVYANLRFVISIAKQYQGKGLPLSDLINEGNLGLFKAAMRFDETRGFKFISYAVSWIRQCILEALAKQVKIVRLPENKINWNNSTRKLIRNYEQEFEREPTAEEIAEMTNTDIEIVLVAFAADARHVSLDAPLSDEGDSATHGDMLTSEWFADGKTTKSDLSSDVMRVLNTLKHQIDKDSILGRFGFYNLSLYDVAKKYNVSENCIEEKAEKAIRKLSRRSDILKQYICQDIQK